MHAEAELARLRDVLLRLTWERDHLKQAHGQVAALGDDATITAARDIARGVLTRITTLRV